MKSHFARSTPNSIRSRRWLTTVSLLLVAGLSPALATSIQAEIDRNPVRLGETFDLTLSSSESPDDDPDLSPLQDSFEVLGSGSNSGMSIVNGKMTRSYSWQITLSPKHAGTLTIPPVHFGTDVSPALSVTVEEAPQTTADAPLFLEVDASPRNPYVQAQVVYTLRLIWRGSLTGAEFKELSVPDALVELLADKRNYFVERNGERYQVIEYKYALFPQKSGKLHIEPMTAKVQSVDDRRLGGFFGRQGNWSQLTSQAIDLEVRPVPAAFLGKHWLPAEALELAENWSTPPDRLKVGEPVTRTLTLKAIGATLGVLPDLGADKLAGSADGIKPYPDQPVTNEQKTIAGVSSTRQEKAALIPGRPGRYTAAEVNIPWWNTKTDRLETARVPAAELLVQTAGGEMPAPEPTHAAAARAEPSATPLPPNSSQPSAAVPSWWPWVTALLALGWLGTLLAWWWTRRSVRAAETPPPARPQQPVRLDSRAVLKALAKACEVDDAVATRHALLQWAEVIWGRAATTTLSGLANQVDEEFAARIRELDRSLYARQGTSTWRGDGLWKSVQEYGSKAKSAAASAKADLEPLNRIGDL